MNKSVDIQCKYCRCEVGCVGVGKGPHAYEVICNNCGHHVKWASALDIDDHTLAQLNVMLTLAEQDLVVAQTQDKYGEMKAAEKKIEKIKHKIQKQESQ